MPQGLCNAPVVFQSLEEVHYLGHVLSPGGIRLNQDKVETIESFPVLCKIKHPRSFLEMIGYYCKFMRNFAVIAKTLYDLTKTGVPF